MAQNKGVVVTLVICLIAQCFTAPAPFSSEESIENRSPVNYGGQSERQSRQIIDQSQEQNIQISQDSSQLSLRLQILLALLLSQGSMGSQTIGGNQNCGGCNSQGEIILKLPLQTVNPQFYALHLLQNPELLCLISQLIEVCGGNSEIFALGMHHIGSNSGGLLGGLGGLLGGQGGGLLGGLGGLLGGQGNGGLLGGLGGLLGGQGGQGGQGGLLGGLGGLLGGQGHGGQGGLLGGLGGLLGGAGGGQGGLLGGLGGLLGGKGGLAYGGGNGGLLGGLGGLLGGSGGYGQGGLLGGLGGLLGGGRGGGVLGGVGGLLDGKGNGLLPGLGKLLGGGSGGSDKGGITGNILGGIELGTGENEGGILASDSVGGGLLGSLLNNVGGGALGGLLGGSLNGVLGTVKGVTKDLPVVGGILRRHANEPVEQDLNSASSEMSASISNDEAESHNVRRQTPSVQYKSIPNAIKKDDLYGELQQESQNHYNVIQNQAIQKEATNPESINTLNGFENLSEESAQLLGKLSYLNQIVLCGRAVRQQLKYLEQLLNYGTKTIVPPSQGSPILPIPNCSCEDDCSCLSQLNQFSDKTKPKRKYRRRKYKIVEATTKEIDAPETQIPTNTDDCDTPNQIVNNDILRQRYYNNGHQQLVNADRRNDFYLR